MFLDSNYTTTAWHVKLSLCLHAFIPVMCHLLLLKQ